MRGEPTALNDVGKRVVDVVEVEMQPERRGRADHRLTVERDELSAGKQLDVSAIVRRLEPLRVVERRKAGLLQRLELMGVLGLRLHDDETVREAPVVPHRRQTPVQHAAA